MQLYRDSRDCYKQGQTKGSLSLQHFLGVETGFTLDKESNTLGIICQDVIVVLAFDTRERLIQWQVKISSNLGEDHQFLVLLFQSPPKSKISTGSVRLHVREMKFCMTAGIPQRLLGIWEIGHLRRYGVVDGKFCFEGGSRCGKGEGLFILVTDQGAEITQTLQLAAQGKLSSYCRQNIRKPSLIDSSQEELDSRKETWNPDLQDVIKNSAKPEIRLHPEPHPAKPSWWSTESRNLNFRNNFGLDDNVSVQTHSDSVWQNQEEIRASASLDRCVSCISKLGISRSSTSNTPTSFTSFNPAWTMEPFSVCFHRNSLWGSGSDCLSVSSHETGSSDYSDYSSSSKVSLKNQQNLSSPPLPAKDNWKKDMNIELCKCNLPYRCSKPMQELSNSCLLIENENDKFLLKAEGPIKNLGENTVKNAYENYDVPKFLLKKDCKKQYISDTNNKPSMRSSSDYHYDTPKKDKCLQETSSFPNYDTLPPAKTLRKPCGCVVTFARQAVDSSGKVICLCQGLCGAEKWMVPPYLKEGFKINLNSIPIHKVKLNGEGKMPVVSTSGELAVFNKTNNSKKPSSNSKNNAEPFSQNKEYANFDFAEMEQRKLEMKKVNMANYENAEFAHSLDFYENSRAMQGNTKCFRKLGNSTENSFDNPDESKILNNNKKICSACRQTCEVKSNYLNESQDKVSGENLEGKNSDVPDNKKDINPGNDLGLNEIASKNTQACCYSNRDKGEDAVTKETFWHSDTIPTRSRSMENNFKAIVSSRKRSSSADSFKYFKKVFDSEPKKFFSACPSQTSVITHEINLNSAFGLPYSRTFENSTKNNFEEEIFGRELRKGLSTESSEGITRSGSLKTLVNEEFENLTPTRGVMKRSLSVPNKMGNKDDIFNSKNSGFPFKLLKQTIGHFSSFDVPLASSVFMKKNNTKGEIAHELTQKSNSLSSGKDFHFHWETSKGKAKPSLAKTEASVHISKKGKY